MAVGGPQQNLVVPSAQELAGGQMTPAVTPSAVTIMSEALRNGFLHADDIIARTGKRAQLKERADVMALQQQMSPETLAAQDVMRRAAVTKAQGSIDVAPGEVARAQAENKMAADIAEAGVGFSDVAKNLSSQGQQIPRTPEGKIDVSAAFAESANIDRFRAAQSAAIANKPEKQTVTLASGAQQSVDWDKLTNRQISLTERDARYAAIGKTANYNVWKTSDLFGPAPGQVAAPQDMPPAPIIEPKAPVNANKLRAEMINAGRLDIGAGLSDEALLEQFPQTELVTPKVAPVAAKPDVMPSTELSGVGSSVIKEAPAEKALATPHYTETQQKALMALTRALATNDSLLRAQENDKTFNPADIKSQVRMGAYKKGTIGQVAATIGQITPAERQYATASNAWIQGLLRAESGAAIAAKEQSWYEDTFFPAAGDPASIQQQKASMRKAVEQTFEQVIQGKMTPEEYQGFRDTISSQNTAAVAAPAATAPASPASAKPTRVPAKDAAGNVIPYVWIEQ